MYDGVNEVDDEGIMILLCDGTKRLLASGKQSESWIGGWGLVSLFSFPLLHLSPLTSHERATGGVG